MPAYMMPMGGDMPGQQFPGQQYPGQRPTNTGFAIDELTDDDFSPVKAVARPGLQQQKSTSTKKDPLAQYVGEVQKEKEEKNKEFRESAATHVRNSIGILVFLGLLGITVNGWGLLTVETMLESMQGEVQEDEFEGEEFEDFEDEDSFSLADLLRAAYIIKIMISVLFLGCAAGFFKLPLTCAIVAIVAFVIGEIIAFLLNPFLLIHIRGWIVRIVIFGGLVQSLNNASYYRFVKKGGRDEK